MDGLSGLARASAYELRQVKGIGEVKAAQIKAALELGRRATKTPRPERPIVRSPAEAANLLMPEMNNLEQEHTCAILLNTRNHVLSTPTIYIGNLNSTVIRVAELFRAGIRQNAASIIVAHNHPSGDPAPSPEDLAITRKGDADSTNQRLCSHFLRTRNRRQPFILPIIQYVNCWGWS